MLNSLFFESSRLTILKYCAMILDKNGKILYMNSPCLIKLARLCRALRSPKFVGMTFDGIMPFMPKGLFCKYELSNGCRLLIEKAEDGINPAFPNIYENNLYIKSAVFKGKILIPFLFGNIIEYSSGANVFDGKKLASNGVLPKNSFSAVPLLIEDIAVCISEKIKATAKGRYDLVFSNECSKDAAVIANAVDISLMLFLSAWSMSKLSLDRRVKMGVSVSKGFGAFMISVSNKDAHSGARRKIDSIFEGFYEEREILASVANIAEIYDWTCIVKEKHGEFVMLISLPSVSYLPDKFREDGKALIQESVDSVYGILNGILSAQ